ncbi:MAG TPA: deoxynucleoside kinase [Gammaproteobacteria bacterium]|nr:deoxynucleoside kinase [Xanthomonadales bacterium]HOP22529.1 deoxynucleoside kinase [Gammaproteobacteria bacterium]HPI95182.1 deoxynucleoside kinase [Gammaproteobacteria bacterium]HPQ86719.1 deoxynucleoside kinase [Gammaproteobacteria bacterium]
MTNYNKKTIAIAGNIGAGKTSLVEFLKSTYDITPFYEPNDENPYLADFYKDMKRWAFHSQLYFLSNKFRIHQQVDSTSGVVVQDRTIFEDVEIFATALFQMRKISKRDWKTYRDFYESIMASIKPPDLMIYLKCSIPTIRKRIKIRGRKMEQDIPLSYLKRLHNLYENWIGDYKLSKLLVLESDKLDYVCDLIDRLDVMQQIESLLPKLTRS